MTVSGAWTGGVELAPDHSQSVDSLGPGCALPVPIRLALKGARHLLMAMVVMVMVTMVVMVMVTMVTMDMVMIMIMGLV